MLLVVRTATTLHRLLDTLPALAGDPRISPVFTLVPGSAFDADALAALDGAGARSIPWDEAVSRPFDLILAASPNGELQCLEGPLVLLPHGAGFNKRADVPGAEAGTEPEAGAPGSGTADGEPAAAGLSPEQLLHQGRPVATLHGLAHPGQLARLGARCPEAVAPATVVGDPTLDRVLDSAARREGYRAAFGTGARRLVVLTSTWGEESLFARCPDLPAQLVTHLPYDAYQVAFVLHPNEHVRRGRFALHQHLAPALDAGLLPADPYEGWGAALVAADCVISDHGSTALYAAALDRPVLAVRAAGRAAELLPGSPMDRLLADAPQLDDRPGAPPYAEQLEKALADHRPGSVRECAASAFAEQGRSLELLRDHLYRLLGLTPPPAPQQPRPLPFAPDTGPVPRTPPALTVSTGLVNDTVYVERRPVTGPPGGHVAAEEGLAGTRQTRSAGLVFRRARPRDAGTAVPAGSGPPSPHRTADDWTRRTLAALPGCRTAGVVLASDHCVLRVRDGAVSGDGAPGRLLSARIAHDTAHGPPTAHPDPAAVLSGLHTWLHAGPRRAPTGHRTQQGAGTVVRCVVAGVVLRVELAAATEQEAALLL